MESTMTIWERLFGTPERAARTLEEAFLDSDAYCDMLDAIGDRPTLAEKCANCYCYKDKYGECRMSGLTALEWLSHEFVEQKGHDERIAVIRCKDCKHCATGFDGPNVCKYRPSMMHTVALDDFCSRAERREDA
ncbi:MAG: hypothetical protein IKG21_13045 [Atopobiaceae bacterium]|nr:hypothetical protein [Atopobiaceae bacterium]